MFFSTSLYDLKLFSLLFLLFLSACSEKMTVQFGSEEQSVQKSAGKGAIVVNLKRSSKNSSGIPFAPASHTDREVLIPYNVSGTAISGVHHNLNSGTVRIPRGAGSVALQFSILDGSFQGTKTIVLQMGQPDDGELGTPTTHTVYLVDGFPTGSVAINNGDLLTNSTQVDLSLSSWGSTEMYVTSTPGCETGGEWEPYSITKPWTLTNENAMNTVYVQYRDAAHILSPCYSDSILHDNIPPTDPTIVINNGDSETASTAVNLTLAAVEATQMYVTNTSGCGSGGSWETYSVNKSWNLQQTNSNATVFVKYRDDAKNETACVSDSIIHDSLPPTGGTILINNGDQYTQTTAVTLALSAASANQMYVTNTAGCATGGTWENYATSKSWTLAQTNSTATVYVKYRDNLFNETVCYNDTIIHDNIPPSSGSILINNGDAKTTHVAVTLTLSSIGAYQMYVTNTAGCASGGSWESYATSKNWTLGQANTIATVYVKYRDQALNETSCFEDSILHQTFDPETAGAVLVDGGDRDDHGHATAGPDNIFGTSDDINVDGWLFIEQMVEFAIAGNLNHAAKDILVIGASSSALNAIKSAAVVQSLNVKVVTGAAVSTENFNNYRLVYVPSDGSNSWGGISNSDLSLLKQRKVDIQDFINGGGSLIALTEEGALEPYAWLELPLPFSIGHVSGTELHKTQAAIQAGFTISDEELSAGTPYHNSFVGPPNFNGLVPFVRDLSNQVITLGFSSLLR